MAKSFRILSLSGGGIRGIYQACFLKKLEHQLGYSLNKNFDLICGTSTGAIVGLAIATEINLDDIVNLYKQKGELIFKKKFFGEIRRGPLYDQNNLKQELLKTFGSKKLRDIENRVLITSSSINKVKHKIFSNFTNDTFDLDLSIVEIILSSTAAPTFFSPVKPSRGEQFYVDGGLWANSPSQVAINYAHKILGVSYDRIHMISIGTSKSDEGITFDKFRKMRQLSFSAPKTIIDLFFSTQESYAQKFCLDLLGEERFLHVNSHTKEYLALDNVNKALKILPSLAEQKVDEHFNKIKKLISDGENNLNGKSFDVRRNTLIDDYLVEETGLSGFYPSRDYYKFRNTSSTLESYISSARDDLIFVSISLVKGINFDDLRNVLIKKISTQTESGNDFKVIISLLNPDKEFLMESLASVFEKDINSIRDEIKQTAKKLKELKKKLPNKKKKNLILRYHNAIPFGSAIIIDKDAKYGKIQIETKPYKSPHNKSFAFEIIPVAENGFFVTLVNAYEELIKDGEPMK